METLALASLFFSLLLLLYKLLFTKDIYEKLLIANSLSTHAILIIISIAFYHDGSTAVIDIALIYSCIGFLTTIAFSHYFYNKT